MDQNLAWSEVRLRDITRAVYNIYSGHIMRCVLEERNDGITIGGKRETNLRFAQDKTLLSSSKEELVALHKKVKEASMSQNLLLNTHFKTSWWWIKAEKGKRTSF